MVRVTVEVEEEVYSYRPAENGAGPMWCHGNTCIVRLGEEVYASGLRTLDGVKPLHNCAPLLYHRTKQGWREVFRHEERTREPSPLACFPDGRILLSLNPTRAPTDAYSGPAEPMIAQFDPSVGVEPEYLRPEWDGRPEFTEHSYRSFAADGPRKELILFQNVGMSHAEFAFRDANGAWASRGRLAWPWGAGYDEPQPIRVCYPNVQLKNRAVHLCGVSDVVEPYAKWRDFKRQLTGQKWDYDFRRLFFTWSDDIGTGRFHVWTEIASRDRTCGWLFPCDMHVDDLGDVHLLWTERAIDERLRSTFFPLEKQEHLLCHAILRDGNVLFQQAIAAAGDTGEIPDRARFQATPGGRLFVLYHVSAPGGGSRNLLRELTDRGAVGEPCPVPLRTPLPSFYTGTVRGGSEPSNVVDLLGEVGNTIRYARVRLEG